MILVVITQITLKKVMQILEGSMSFVDRYNLITEIFNFCIILEKIREKRWNMLLHITQIHTPERCPKDEGGTKYCMTQMWKELSYELRMVHSLNM